MLRTRLTFSRPVTVPVGISKLGLTDLIFVLAVKIYCGYYRDIFLSQQLLPVLHDVSGDFFIFQQDSAPAHRTPTLRFVEQSTTAFICSRRIAPSLIRSITRYEVTSSSEYSSIFP